VDIPSRRVLCSSRDNCTPADRSPVVPRPFSSTSSSTLAAYTFALDVLDRAVQS